MDKLKTRASNLIEKNWGGEMVIVNNENYCGKILYFKPNSRFSMHLHKLKKETWSVIEGAFTLTTIDTDNANKQKITLVVGDIIDIPPMLPHQLSTETGGRIFEISTQHFDYDSYRVEKGDSQL
jgi:mannose-6-phosphate isomerase-like protein (cupin superfamily)